MARKSLEARGSCRNARLDEVWSAFDQLLWVFGHFWVGSTEFGTVLGVVSTNDGGGFQHVYVGSTLGWARPDFGWSRPVTIGVGLTIPGEISTELGRLRLSLGWYRSDWDGFRPSSGWVRLDGGTPNKFRAQPWWPAEHCLMHTGPDRPHIYRTHACLRCNLGGLGEDRQTIAALLAGVFRMPFRSKLFRRQFWRRAHCV